jgi:hypothetical protein
MINVLVSIARQPKAPASARAQAAACILDRGWGKAPQEHTGPDGGDIKVTIRQIIEKTEVIASEPEDEAEPDDEA